MFSVTFARNKVIWSVVPFKSFCLASVGTTWNKGTELTSVPSTVTYDLGQKMNLHSSVGGRLVHIPHNKQKLPPLLLATMLLIQLRLNPVSACCCCGDAVWSETFFMHGH